MTDEAEYDGSDAAAEALAEVRAEVMLLRRAIEGLTAERGAIDMPDYSETLGRMQQGVDATADRIAVINDVIARSPALAMTPEQMAQRIAAAGSAARREDQAALAKAGEDKARVMAELRTIAGSAWTRADQKNRQLWFGVGGVAIGIVAWAIVPGLVVREIAPTSWHWPERMAASTLDMPMWDGARRLAGVSQPEAWNAMLTGALIVQANREAIERCSKAASKARELVRCTVRVGPDSGQ
ncbi:DUF6118 family protein [Sphingomonas sp. PL20]|uniref:DUF6118 family protein n=1 Tax=Sphingomonas sp. PL20 TaxID=2760712 RepID=UPI001AE212E6